MSAWFEARGGKTNLDIEILAGLHAWERVSVGHSEGADPVPTEVRP